MTLSLQSPQSRTYGRRRTAKLREDMLGMADFAEFEKQRIKKRSQKVAAKQTAKAERNNKKFVRLDRASVRTLAPPAKLSTLHSRVYRRRLDGEVINSKGIRKT